MPRAMVVGMSQKYALPLFGDLAARAQMELAKPTIEQARQRLGGAADPIVLLSRQVGRRSLFAACRPVEGADTLRMPTEALRHLGPGPASLAALRIARTPLALEGLDGALLFVTRDATELTLPEPGIPEEPVR